MASVICDAADAFIDSFMDPPSRRPSADPLLVFSGNFAPVSELPPANCHLIRGSIPASLAGGAYIRNGPNPQHLFPSRTHHLFDGDGMLHSILLSPLSGADIAGTLSSRFVRTYKYRLELGAGGPVLPNFFSGFHGAAGVARGAVAMIRALAGQVSLAEGIGLANTSLASFGGRLFALGESDLPYAVALSPVDGDVLTVGREDFGGELAVPMTAHPKKDPDTGEVFAFGYGFSPAPFLTYFRFDGAGEKVAGGEVSIKLRDSSFIHDFAITKRFAVFPDSQIMIDPMKNMVLGGGSVMGFDREKVPRLGLLPRYASSESEMKWYDVPGFNMVHTINAWEEGGAAVVLVATNLLSAEEMVVSGSVVASRTRVEVVRIDTTSGTVTRTPLPTPSADFGVINLKFAGRRSRYAYLGIGNPLPKIGGLAKLDLSVNDPSECVVARREFGPGCFAGEPFFVPANNGVGEEKEEEEEDEGYLVTYVHNEGTGMSTFVVMDAQSPELEVVAEVLLPRRVPYGFHGIFVGCDELRSCAERR